MSQEWRGVAGLVRPTYRPGTLMQMIRLLPEGIGVIPFYLGLRSGTATEFIQAIKTAEQRVDELAAIGVDTIYVGGAPPPMLLGYDADHRLAAELSRKHGIPVNFASTGLVKALQAFSIKKLVGITYFGKELNDRFSTYLTDAGFQVRAMEGIECPFGTSGNIPATEAYALAKKTFLKAGGADAIYFLGNGWSVLPIVEMLERDLQTTVIAGEQVTIWNILQALRVREPIKGCGKLLAEKV